MGKRLELEGMVTGCLTAIKKVQSRITPGGTLKGYWLVRCTCGKEKEMNVQTFVKHKGISCGSGCSHRGDAMVTVCCMDCGVKYNIRNDSLRKNIKENNVSRHVCGICKSRRSSDCVRGKPAHNRLPGDVGALNNLFARYKVNAKNRNISFEITKDEFRAITKQDCYLCGKKPSGKWGQRKGSAELYIYNGIDRLDSKIGYVSSNLMPCCSACNYMKSDMELTEFLTHIDDIINYRNQSNHKGIL